MLAVAVLELMMLVLEVAVAVLDVAVLEAADAGGAGREVAC